MQTLADIDELVEGARENAVMGRILRNAVKVQTSAGWGSGVALGDDWVLTATHVLLGKDAETATVFHPADNVTTTVTEMRANWRRADLAILKLARPLDVSPVALAENVQPKERVITCDIRKLKEVFESGDTGQGIIRHGRYSAPMQCSTGETKSDLNLSCYLFNIFARPGNSGGGIYNAAGQLVSIVHARDTSCRAKAYGAEPTKLKPFLSYAVPQLYADFSK